MRYILHFFSLILVVPAFAQDIDDLINAIEFEETSYASASFKANRILNGHSIEMAEHGELDFRISHRFGELNGGAYELFGLDQAFIHFSFEYGFAPWLTAGIGRSNVNKVYDGFVKFRLLRQSSGKKNIPIFLTYVASSELTTLRFEQDIEFRHRVDYVHQLLIARKFNPTFSFQLSPTLVHQNLVPNKEYANDVYALGIGGRLKLTNRVTLNAEAFLTSIALEDFEGPKYHHPISVGFDIETGGHVFQLIFTNSLSMREAGFITNTTGNWLDGDIHFGFNISRVFTIVDY